MLYGFAPALLDASVTAMIDPSTGGFSSSSSGPDLLYANSAAVTSNAQFLYVSNSYIDGQPNNGSQIVGCFISAIDGTLTPISGSPFFTNLLTSASIQGLATTPNGQFLYGADANGFIYAFSINSATGAPASISGSPFVSGPNYQLVVDPSGKFLYASDLPRSGVRQLGPLYWPNIPEVE